MTWSKPHSYQELQSQDLNLSIALISKLVCCTSSLWMSSEDIRDWLVFHGTTGSVCIRDGPGEISIWEEASESRSNAGEMQYHGDSHPNHNKGKARRGVGGLKKREISRKCGGLEAKGYRKWKYFWKNSKVRRCGYRDIEKARWNIHFRAYWVWGYWGAFGRKCKKCSKSLYLW